MHHFPWRDWCGNCPFICVYAIALFHNFSPYKEFKLGVLNDRMHEIIFDSLVSLIPCIWFDCSPFCVQFMWPFTVAVDSGKCLQTSVKVIWGKPISCSFLIALHNVSIVVGKRHWWRNCSVSANVELWYMLLATCFWLQIVFLFLYHWEESIIHSFSFWCFSWLQHHCWDECSPHCWITSAILHCINLWLKVMKCS